VLPKSHEAFLKLGIEARADFVPIPKAHEVLTQFAPKVVICKAGDLVLWDSRLIHCNSPGNVTPRIPDKAKGEQWQLLRAVVYVCMTPADFAENLPELRVKRADAFHNGKTTNHWPHEFHVSLQNNTPHPNSLVLTPSQRALLYGLGPDEEYDDCYVWDPKPKI